MKPFIPAPRPVIPPTTVEELEAEARRLHSRYVGCVVLVPCVIGYLDTGHDTVERYPGTGEPLFRVRILPTDNQSICHWNDEYLDPYWDVEPLDERLAGLRSTWIDGPSVNALTGEKGDPPEKANVQLETYAKGGES